MSSGGAHERRQITTRATAITNGDDMNKKTIETETIPAKDAEAFVSLDPQQRSSYWLIRAEGAMQKAYDAEAEAFKLTPLEWYPIRANLLRKSIQELSEKQAFILKPFDETLLAIRQAIAEETGSDGKARYSNDAKRADELMARSAMIYGYPEAVNDQAALTLAIARLRIALQFVEEQFSVARALHRERYPISSAF